MSTMEPIRSGLRLRVLEGAYHSPVLKLERSVISLGRSTPESAANASYLTFPEPTVSRLHAVMTWEVGAKAYLLHHRSQTNPTVLNNAVISGPHLLKAGDRITLGRLVLLVEPEGETAGESGALLSPAPPVELSLNAKLEGGERLFSAPVRERVVAVTFLNDRSTSAVTPIQNLEGWQDVRLPGSFAGALRFELDPDTGTCTVEAGPENEAPTIRLSHGRAGGELRVPLRAGQSLPFVETDVILHQGFRIWLGHPDRSPDAGSTLSQKPKDGEDASDSRPGVTLTYLNGPWKDATTTASRDSANFRIGPGDIGFRHPFPLSQLPQCEINVQDGDARLRAIEVSDDQFLEVDGDLVFAGEAVPLLGGSRLLVGDAEFLWSDGSESVYGNYRLVDGVNSYPIRKASVRLGTAAHCEILLSRRELPPVIGRISFESGSPVYHHIDISAPIRVDGEEASTGLSLPLRHGSLLELRPGITLTLEQNSPKT